MLTTPDERLRFVNELLSKDARIVVSKPEANASSGNKHGLVVCPPGDGKGGNMYTARWEDLGDFYNTAIHKTDQEDWKDIEDLFVKRLLIDYEGTEPSAAKKVFKTISSQLLNLEYRRKDLDMSGLASFIEDQKQQALSDADSSKSEPEPQPEPRADNRFSPKPVLRAASPASSTDAPRSEEEVSPKASQPNISEEKMQLARKFVEAQKKRVYLAAIADGMSLEDAANLKPAIVFDCDNTLTNGVHFFKSKESIDKTAQAKIKRVQQDPSLDEMERITKLQAIKRSLREELGEVSNGGFGISTAEIAKDSSSLTWVIDKKTRDLQLKDSLQRKETTVTREQVIDGILSDKELIQAVLMVSQEEGIKVKIASRSFQQPVKEFFEMAGLASEDGGPGQFKFSDIYGRDSAEAKNNYAGGKPIIFAGSSEYDPTRDVVVLIDDSYKTSEVSSFVKLDDRGKYNQHLSESSNPSVYSRDGINFLVDPVLSSLGVSMKAGGGGFNSLNVQSCVEALELSNDRLQDSIEKERETEAETEIEAETERERETQQQQQPAESQVGPSAQEVGSEPVVTGGESEEEEEALPPAPTEINPVHSLDDEGVAAQAEKNFRRAEAQFLSRLKEGPEVPLSVDPIILRLKEVYEEASEKFSEALSPLDIIPIAFNFVSKEGAEIRLTDAQITSLATLVGLEFRPLKRAIPSGYVQAQRRGGPLASFGTSFRDYEVMASSDDEQTAPPPQPFSQRPANGYNSEVQSSDDGHHSTKWAQQSSNSAFLTSAVNKFNAGQSDNDKLHNLQEYLNEKLSKSQTANLLEALGKSEDGHNKLIDLAVKNRNHKLLAKLDIEALKEAGLADSLQDLVINKLQENGAKFDARGSEQKPYRSPETVKSILTDSQFLVNISESLPGYSKMREENDKIGLKIKDLKEYVQDNSAGVFFRGKYREKRSGLMEEVKNAVEGFCETATTMLGGRNSPLLTSEFTADYREEEEFEVVGGNGASTSEGLAGGGKLYGIQTRVGKGGMFLPESEDERSSDEEDLNEDLFAEETPSASPSPAGPAETLQPESQRVGGRGSGDSAPPRLVPRNATGRAPMALPKDSMA